MITTKIQWWLWNQMFQYAFAKSLSIDLWLELRIEKSFYVCHSWNKKLSNRHYNLNIFHWCKNLITNFNVPRYAKNYSNSYIEYLAIKFKNTFNLNNIWYFNEKIWWYNEDIVSKIKERHNIILDWVRQSEKFFEWNSEIIKKEYEFEFEQSKYSEIMCKRIFESNSISLHIRRWDYLNSANNKLFMQYDSVYYRDAMSFIAKKINNPIFFIFCEDQARVRENIESKYNLVYIDPNLDKPYEDMRMMSLCKHHIVCNSTFSWRWAWLWKNINKIIIHPKKLFTYESKLDDSNFYPKNRIAI